MWAEMGWNVWHSRRGETWQGRKKLSALEVKSTQTGRPLGEAKACGFQVAMPRNPSWLSATSLPGKQRPEGSRVIIRRVESTRHERVSPGVRALVRQGRDPIEDPPGKRKKATLPAP